MYKYETICQLAEKVINCLVKNENKEGLFDHLTIDKWEWPQGVALYSLYKYYKITGKKEIFDFLTQWYDKKLIEGTPGRNVNTMAPMLALAFVYEETKKPAYLALIEDWANWVMTQMPRTEEHGLQHITSDDENPQQLWDDTLFMTVLFLGKAGLVLNRPDMVEEAKYQFMLHIKYLFNAETGLWYHGWSFIGRHHFGKIFWARGNCWYTAAAVEAVEILGIEGALKELLIHTLETQVKALVKLQDKKGMWHTVLDDPDSYVETSASAGFTYGMLKAVRLGLIDRKYFDSAIKAANEVIANVAENGAVGNVSYGTAMGMDKEHYLNIPIVITAYGQGLTFLMLTEILQLADK